MAAPTVLSISPAFGSFTLATPVTITGTDFTGTTGVLVGGIAATAVVVVNDEEITCSVPARPEIFRAHVQVTNADGTGQLSNVFLFTGLTTFDTDVGDGVWSNAVNWTYGVVTGEADGAVTGSGPITASGGLAASTLTFADYTGTLTPTGVSFDIYGEGAGGLADLTLSSGMTIAGAIAIHFWKSGTYDAAGQVIETVSTTNGEDIVLTLASSARVLDLELDSVDAVIAQGANDLYVGSAEDTGPESYGYLLVGAGCSFTWTSGRLILDTSGEAGFEMDYESDIELPPIEVVGTNRIFQDGAEPILATSLLVTQATLDGGEWTVSGTAVAEYSEVANCDFTSGTNLDATNFCTDGGGTDGVDFPVAPGPLAPGSSMSLRMGLGL